jgi:4-hydroxy-3-methylbut-2-en-1-yl diphosphate reductase
MEVITASVAWCVGIENAYRRMHQHASGSAGTPSYTTHHAQQAGTETDMDTLRRIAQGDAQLLTRYPALQHVQVVSDLATVPRGATLLVGFQGLARDTMEELTGRGITVKNYKCPFIAKLDATVERLVAEGCDILILGKRQNHHCQYAQEVAAAHQRQCRVLETLADVDTIPGDAGAQWALVGQVTGNTLLWQAVVERLRQRGVAVQVRDTICSDSYQRQETALALASQADRCVIVDDGGAASQSLFEVLSGAHPQVTRVRWREDGSWKDALDVHWLTDARRVAVVGGILVPQWALDAVAAYIESLA